MARLDHPCIVTLFDVGTCDSGPYLVMELLRGKTLAQRIAEGPIPQAEALRIAEEMAKGLAHAHQRGVLHRDLKPANVFLCEDGRVKLLDFGLAHLLGHRGRERRGNPDLHGPRAGAGRGGGPAGRRVRRRQGAGRDARGAAPPTPGASHRPGHVHRPGGAPRDGQAWLDLLQTARRGSSDQPDYAAWRCSRDSACSSVGSSSASRSTAHRSGRRGARQPQASIAVLPFRT